MYGFIDSLNAHNIPYFRTVLSVFNTLASLGCFFLARRLCRSYWAGLVALVFASVYPPFSVQTGRLFPDPITGCLLVWSAYLFLRGAQEKSKRAMFGAGLTLTAALFIRPQLFNYVLLLLLVSVATTAYWWWREHKLLVAALLLGCLPFTSLWVGIVQAVGDDLEEIEAFGNFTFQQRYPYGFWQFLDSDGWMGPYRLEQEPYYKAMEAKAADDPELLESYPRQLVFTAGYVASRPSASALMFLDNIYRSLRPARERLQVGLSVLLFDPDRLPEISTRRGDRWSRRRLIPPPELGVRLLHPSVSRPSPRAQLSVATVQPARDAHQLRFRQT